MAWYSADASVIGATTDGATGGKSHRRRRRGHGLPPPAAPAVAQLSQEQRHVSHSSRYTTWAASRAAARPSRSPRRGGSSDRRGEISSGSRTARIGVVDQAGRMLSKASGPPANVAAAFWSCPRSAANGVLSPAAYSTAWQSRRGRPPGTRATGRPPPCCAARRHRAGTLLRMARSLGSRRVGSRRAREARVRAVRARSPKVAVQDGVLQHADLLGRRQGADSSFSSSLPAAAGGRAPGRRALQEHVEQVRRRRGRSRCRRSGFLGGNGRSPSRSSCSSPPGCGRS